MSHLANAFVLPGRGDGPPLIGRRSRLPPARAVLENNLRRHAGQAGYRGGFIASLPGQVVYPPGLTRGMQIGLGVMVLLAAITAYQGFLRRQMPGRDRATGVTGQEPSQCQLLLVGKHRLRNGDRGGRGRSGGGHRAPPGSG
jgi:hypothetical protein